MPTQFRTYGTVTIQPLASPTVEPVQTLEATYHWTPHASLIQELPQGFVMEFECWRRFDGTRYFIGRGGRERTFARGFAAGLAILSSHESWSAEQRSSERVRFLVFRLMRRMKEFQRRRFQRISDLRIRSSSREIPGMFSVLPSGVLLSRTNEDELEPIREFLSQGEDEAKKRGVHTPTVSEKIQYGLVAAARMHPLQVPSEKVELLVRNALFVDMRTGPETLTEDVRELLEERILMAIWRHLPDTDEEFDNWIAGSESSFIKQIAKQKKARGGEFSPEIVREVLLDLGWAGYLTVAQCLEFAARDFRRALPDPLSETESTLFERIYFRQPAWGGLSLLMLSERFPELEIVASDYLNYQDPQQVIPVMHSLLFYYSEMATARRSADRRGKRESRHRQRRGRAQNVSYQDWMRTPSEDQDDESNELK